jgi:hypothetical protein
MPRNRLLGATIILGCTTVFVPPHWLKGAAQGLIKSASAWKTYFALSDRAKRLLGPFATIQNHQYWFPMMDGDLQLLLDQKLIYQKDRYGEFVLVKMTDDGRDWLRRFRKLIRQYSIKNASDKVGKALAGQWDEAAKRTMRRL